MYKFNSDLELRHIQHEDRIATYRNKKKGDYFAPATVLIYLEGKEEPYIVASFNECLHCNNAQSFLTYQDAWRDFIKFVQMDLEAKDEPMEKKTDLADIMSSVEAEVQANPWYKDLQ